MAQDAQSIKNIIVGAAAVYVTTTDSTNAAFSPKVTFGTPTPNPATDLDTTLDAYKAMDALVLAGKWRDVGFTNNGVEVAYEPSFGEVTVDQLLDSAKIFKQSMKVTVNTTFAEATLENLLVVWGQNADTLTPDGADTQLDIVPGELGDDPFERGLTFVGPSPRRINSTGGGSTQYDRVYNVTRAIQDQNTNHALKRSEATEFPVSFRLLPDSGEEKSRYGVVRDRARTA